MPPPENIAASQRTRTQQPPATLWEKQAGGNIAASLQGWEAARNRARMR